MQQSATSFHSPPSFLELFTPKLLTVLREGYSLRDFRADSLAGLTVAIVALPLSMAIAIASGATPAHGLYTAIIGGFLISALGGSRFQIGGPAGAFIVLVAAAIERHGIDGFALATLLSGSILSAIGLLRLGAYIKFIPYPVTIGFTAGIGIIIFISQIKDLFGLTLADKEPAAILPKLQALADAFASANLATMAVAGCVIALIQGLKRIRPHWPGLLIAVALSALAVWGFDLPVETIGSRFGGIPSGLPLPHFPQISWERLQAVLPDAMAFALLGAIESLLSAVVADGMTGRRHRSNCELVAQGLANIGSALFGGICVTGTIARTATNVRAGAHGPVAGMLHAGFLLAFMLIAAPLASYIPLAALAGVLAIVAWNMVEQHAIAVLMRTRGDTLVLFATLLLTVFRDLSEGIVVGFTLGTLLFLHRMAQSMAIAADTCLRLDDVADDAGPGRTAYRAGQATDREVVIYRLSGAFFFGAASTVGSVLERIADRPRIFILDFTGVPFLDSTAANTIEGLAHKAERNNVHLIITGASPAIRKILLAHGIRPPLVRYDRTVENALERKITPSTAP